LDGALVKQGRIPISKKKLSEKNSELKFAMRLRQACETLSRSRMVITLAADVYLPSQKMLAQQLRQLEADGIMFTRRYHRKLNIDSRIGAGAVSS
jgi:hypothetical protein